MQYAIVIHDDVIYLVFRGTDSLTDGTINLQALPYGGSAHKLQVHGSMWLSLNTAKADVLGRALARIRELRAEKPERRVVYTGHSLGGGYALITALEALVAAEDVARPSRVITFGAPQVVQPEPENPIWEELNRITLGYVNAYDVVPRLPSFQEWMQVIPAAVASTVASTNIAGFQVRLNIDLGTELHEHTDEYDTVGSLMFISKEMRDKAMLIKHGEGHREVLGKLPSAIGTFIIDDHSMTQYVNILKKLKSSFRHAS